MVFERGLSRVCGDIFVASEDIWSTVGASVSKEGRSGPVRAAHVRSELTLGDRWTKMSQVDYGLLRPIRSGQKLKESGAN